jgi:hypothetical protein
VIRKIIASPYRLHTYSGEHEKANSVDSLHRSKILRYFERCRLWHSKGSSPQATMDASFSNTAYFREASNMNY